MSEIKEQKSDQKPQKVEKPRLMITKPKEDIELFTPTLRKKTSPGKLLVQDQAMDENERQAFLEQQMEAYRQERKLKKSSKNQHQQQEQSMSDIHIEEPIKIEVPALQIEREQKNIRYDQLPSISSVDSKIKQQEEMAKAESIKTVQQKNKSKSQQQKKEPPKKRNFKVSDTTEISDQMLGIYTGFIKKKLGLEKKVSNNEMYIFKYHTQLQTKKQRAQSLNDKLKDTPMKNNKLQALNQQDYGDYTRNIMDKRSFDSNKKVKFIDPSQEIKNLLEKNAIVPQHQASKSAMDSIYQKNDSFMQNLNQQVIMNSTMSTGVENLSRNQRNTRSILKNYKTVEQANMQIPMNAKLQPLSTMFNFNPNASAFSSLSQAVDSSRQNRQTQFGSLKDNLRGKSNKSEFHNKSFFDRMPKSSLNHHNDFLEISIKEQQQDFSDNQPLRTFDRQQIELRQKLRKIIDSSEGRSTVMDAVSSHTTDLLESNINRQSPDFFQGIFQSDESNTVRVANSNQFRRLTKLFNQFYDIERIYDIEDLSEIEKQKLEKKMKQKQEGIKLMLMSDINNDFGNKKGMINQTKMFKLNDMQFYVEHINKMLFKTKDPWLYKKYQAYQKLLENKRLQSFENEHEDPEETRKRIQNERTNVFQRMKADYENKSKQPTQQPNTTNLSKSTLHHSSVGTFGEKKNSARQANNLGVQSQLNKYDSQTQISEAAVTPQLIKQVSFGKSKIPKVDQGLQDDDETLQAKLPRVANKSSPRNKKSSNKLVEENGESDTMLSDHSQRKERSRNDLSYQDADNYKTQDKTSQSRFLLKMSKIREGDVIDEKINVLRQQVFQIKNQSENVDTQRSYNQLSTRLKQSNHHL
ncbi:UNKNOWN [Stylonychia lemnae]|uniref:Uncharacterized protein n=1 Tax=Stylonychia lemnae TaxID=5949 RepID=A0A078ABU9_STYLE|nr:UNKNOWN [Stylonychia lemnae]|eukprot:CDW79067.1 UNKNOWN [Stylonychia lemnae]